MIERSTDIIAESFVGPKESPHALVLKLVPQKQGGGYLLELDGKDIYRYKRRFPGFRKSLKIDRHVVTIKVRCFFGIYESIKIEDRLTLRRP